MLAHALVTSVQQARVLWHQQKDKQAMVVAESASGDNEEQALRHAQNLACDILNISQAELDDIMSVGSDSFSKAVKSFTYGLLSYAQIHCKISFSTFVLVPGI